MSCAGTFSYIFFFQGTCFQNEGRLYESEAENDAEADRCSCINCDCLCKIVPVEEKIYCHI